MFICEELTNRSGNPQFRLVCNVSNNYKPILDELKRRYGGQVTEGHSGVNVNYKIVLMTQQCETFLRDIFPFSIIKYRQIDLALEYRMLKRTKALAEERRWFKQEITRLNKGGNLLEEAI